MKIDYTRFDWFTPDVLAAVVDVLKDDPETGRPTLSKKAQISMYKCEKVLEVWRDYDLYQYLDAADPLAEIVEALELGRADDGEEEEVKAAFDDFGQVDYEPSAPYHYIADKDLYVVTIRVKGIERVVNVPGDTHRAMRHAYSDWDGDKQTLNQVAKEFGVSRSWFVSYKNAMGWTHDSDPFTDEEVMANDPDELAERAIQRKRHVLEKKFERKLDEQNRVDAEKYRQLEKLVIDPLLENWGANLKQPKSVPMVDVGTASEPFAAVISPMDLHYGKLGLHGIVQNPYNRVEARERLLGRTNELLKDVCNFGRPEEIIVGMAGDWFHVDTASGTTTRGTPQDLDGHVWQMIDGGMDLAFDFINAIRQVTDKVRIVMVRGNHDSFATMFMIKALMKGYEDYDNVEIIADPRDRTYLTYGSTLMGFCHGDHWTKTKTSRKILTEPDRDMLYETVDRVWFHGHLHHEKMIDLDGVLAYQLESLSGDDIYHDNKGYNESRKGISAFILRQNGGIVGKLFAPVRHS